MLEIRADQFALFEQQALARFEDQMIAHSQRFTPRLCRTLGEAQLRVAIRQMMAGAEGHGFTCRGPVRLYIELSFLYGSGWDDDPQYPRLGRILASGEDQMLRAEWLYQEILDYQSHVSGPEACNVKRALTRLATYVEEPTAMRPTSFAEEALTAMSHIFPEKASYLGPRALTALLNEASSAADLHGIPDDIRGRLLLGVLMFAFGHRCLSDPLYPWIGRTLANPLVDDPLVRIRRLEKKAITWLRHVLSGTWRGVEDTDE